MNYDYLKFKKILLVDDEPALLSMVASILKQEGYSNIITASTAAEAVELCRAEPPQLAVLDVMLPDGDGFTLLTKLRKIGDFPALFLTARGEDEDKYRGLELGADDFLVKPFLPRELTLRIQAVLRRCYKQDAPAARLRACAIDFERAEVVRCGETLPLTAKEFEILQALYRNAGKIVTIDALCEAAWGDNPFGYENSLMAHIRRIREKIEENPSRPVSLITVKGLGYKLILEN